MDTSPEPTKAPEKIYFQVWERTGVTEHMGGIEATEALARMARVASGQLILDIGCGTGYTAAYIARDHKARVICIDLMPGLLTIAGKRITREGLGDRVSFIRADAHHMPFRNGVFDRALAESVLVFCDKEQVANEVSRILKPGGLFGDNELTFLEPPPAELREMLSMDRGLGMEPMTENGWEEIYKNSGLYPVSRRVRRVNFLSQLIDHIRIDGPIRYFSSAIKGITDVRLRKGFFNKYTGKAARKFSSYVGYGLYVSERSMRR